MWLKATKDKKKGNNFTFLLAQGCYEGVGGGVCVCDVISSLTGRADSSFSSTHRLSEVDRSIAPFEVEQGCRQDHRRGPMGTGWGLGWGCVRGGAGGGLVEAGVGVVGVVTVRCKLGRLCR